MTACTKCKYNNIYPRLEKTRKADGTDDVTIWHQFCEKETCKAELPISESIKGQTRRRKSVAPVAPKSETQAGNKGGMGGKR